MANQWLRLWHDMPNDPKFRVVAKVSQQPVSLVMSLYVTLLIDASSNAVSRGVTQCHDEDLAVTLDCDMDKISVIKEAMQGRLLDGNSIRGWDKRQPKREDIGDKETGAKSAAERQRAKRELEKSLAEIDAEFDCHAMSRTVTTEEIKSRQDKEVNPIATDVAIVASGADDGPAEKKCDCPHQAIIDLYEKHLPSLPTVVAWDGQRKQNLKARWRWVMTAKKRNGAPYASNRMEALGFFDRYFAYVAQSDFLTGRSGKWQSCDLGWLVKAENFAKVMQGNYAEKEAQA